VTSLLVLFLSLIWLHPRLEGTGIRYRLERLPLAVLLECDPSVSGWICDLGSPAQVSARRANGESDSTASGNLAIPPVSVEQRRSSQLYPLDGNRIAVGTRRAHSSRVRVLLVL